MHTSKHAKAAFYVAFYSSLFSFIGLVAIIGAQLYIRWYVNQEFTLLGGSELEALTVSVFALLLGTAYLGRKKSD